MDAVVEVTTAEVRIDGGSVSVLSQHTSLYVPVVASASMTVVPSISGHSISAVAPDHILREELALGIAA